MYHRDLETKAGAKAQHDESHKAIAKARLIRVGQKRAELRRKRKAK